MPRSRLTRDAVFDCDKSACATGMLADMPEQNYSNHVKRTPAFGVMLLVLMATVIGAGVNLYLSWGDHQRIYSASLLFVLSACATGDDVRALRPSRIGFSGKMSFGIRKSRYVPVHSLEREWESPNEHRCEQSRPGQQVASMRCRAVRCARRSFHEQRTEYQEKHAGQQHRHG